MPHELSIAPLMISKGTPIGGSGTVGPGPQPPPSAPPSAPPAPTYYPNPRLRLDGGLGMVVIEFRDRGGQVTQSIPSQRQLDAYRSHQGASDAAKPGRQAFEPI